MNWNKNKFEIAHNELIEFCNECTLNKKNDCGRYDEKCREFSNKLEEHIQEQGTPDMETQH